MTRDILKFIANDLNLDISKDEVRSIEHEIKTGEYDFTADIDGEEYRFIREDEIWDIYVEAIKETVEECYTGKLDWWIAIDWEETAENCLQDGYGHTFASYDGKEHEVTINGDEYYVFRTN
jgi:hypothetical protein